jgi:hypothetical protein
MVGTAIDPVTRGCLWRCPDTGLDFSDYGTLALLLDADEIGQADGTRVAAWADTSGNGRDFSQGTEADQPLYKTNILNGHAVVRFARAGSEHLVGASFTEIAQPTTLVLVAAHTELTTSYYPFLVDGLDAGHRHALHQEETSETRINAGSAVGLGDPAVSGTFYYWVVSFNGASSDCRRNGASIGAGNPGAHGCTGLRLGCAYDLNAATMLGGDIALVALYEGAVSGADLTALEAALADRFAL